MEYDVQLQTVVNDGVEKYSASVELSGRTRAVVSPDPDFVELPRINKLEPAIRTVTVRAGERIRLEVNVYGRQDELANKELDAGTGLYDDVTPTFSWQSETGSGSFESPNDGRRVTFVAPNQPGTYLITAEAGPSGICVGHHQSPLEPCRATITVKVTRDPGSADPPPDPVNPAGLLPTSVSDADGNAYAVFTPEEGGTFTDASGVVTVTAEPGAGPDQTLVGVRAESVPMQDGAPTASFARYTLGHQLVMVSVVDATGDVLSGYRFEDPLQVCAPLPVQFRDRLDAVTMVRIEESNAGITVLSSKVYSGTAAGLQICGAVSVLPATLAVARLGVAPTATPEPGTSIGEIETGGLVLGQMPLWLVATVVIGMLSLAMLVISAKFGKSNNRRIYNKG